MTPIQQAMRATLERNPMSNAARKTAWILHDFIVDHENRDAITHEEAIELIALLSPLFPVIAHHRHDDSTEVFMLAQQDNCYIWMSVYLNDDPKAHCATCIADENLKFLDNIVAHLF
jgi:hypothetical protein